MPLLAKDNGEKGFGELSSPLTVRHFLFLLPGEQTRSNKNLKLFPQALATRLPELLTSSVLLCFTACTTEYWTFDK